jgi:hypothetical protein
MLISPPLIAAAADTFVKEHPEAENVITADVVDDDWPNNVPLAVVVTNVVKFEFLRMNDTFPVELIKLTLVKPRFKK